MWIGGGLGAEGGEVVVGDSSGFLELLDACAGIFMVQVGGGGLRLEGLNPHEDFV